MIIAISRYLRYRPGIQGDTYSVLASFNAHYQPREWSLFYGHIWHSHETPEKFDKIKVRTKIPRKKNRDLRQRKQKKRTGSVSQSRKCTACGGHIVFFPKNKKTENLFPSVNKRACCIANVKSGSRMRGINFSFLHSHLRWKSLDLKRPEDLR